MPGEHEIVVAQPMLTLTGLGKRRSDVRRHWHGPDLPDFGVVSFPRV